MKNTFFSTRRIQNDSLVCLSKVSTRNFRFSKSCFWFPSEKRVILTRMKGSVMKRTDLTLISVLRRSQMNMSLNDANQLSVNTIRMFFTIAFFHFYLINSMKQTRIIYSKIFNLSFFFKMLLKFIFELVFFLENLFVTIIQRILVDL